MVSIIIPVWNDAACLKTLLSWLEDEPGDFEIIVCDGGSSDSPAEVIEGFSGVKFIQTPKGRAHQMNAGASIAKGDVLLFLHADTLPPRGYIQQLPGILGSDRADFGAFRIRFDPPVWLPHLLALLSRLRIHWTCYGDQGIFVRREFFQQTGGYPELPFLEDVRWLRIAGHSGRMTRARAAVVTSSRRFQENGTVAQTWGNFWILLRELFGWDPVKLAVAYDTNLEEEPEPARANVAGD